jgi:hypothetical protein
VNILTADSRSPAERSTRERLGSLAADRLGSDMSNAVRPALDASEGGSPADFTTQDGEFVAEHHDLEAFVAIRPKSQDDELQNAQEGY